MRMEGFSSYWAGWILIAVGVDRHRLADFGRSVPRPDDVHLAVTSVCSGNVALVGANVIGTAATAGAGSPVATGSTTGISSPACRMTAIIGTASATKSAIAQESRGAVVITALSSLASVYKRRTGYDFGRI